MYNKDTDIFSDINYLDYLDEHQKIILQHDNRFLKDTNQKDISLNDIRKMYFDRSLNNFVTKWQERCDRSEYSTHFKYCIGDTPEAIDNQQEGFGQKLLKREGYIDIDGKSNNNVSYYMNKHGFRCPEFSDSDCIAYFGCSHTFGLGIDQDDIWTELLANSLGLRSVNISCPAVGIDFWNIYANYFFEHEVKNCKAIVILLPPSIRHSYFCNWYDYENPKYEYHENIFHETGTDLIQMEWIRDFRKKSTLNTGRVPFVHKYFDDTVTEPDWIGHNQNILLGKENCFNRTSAAVFNIKRIAEKLNIPLILESSYAFADDHHADDYDFARDISHYGKRTHKNFSDYLKNKLDNE